MKRAPISSGICVGIMFLAIVVPFALGAERGGQLDIHLRGILPLFGGILTVAAVIRREGAVWTVLGLLLTGIYVGLHLIATA
jgi:hypothetical protein